MQWRKDQPEGWSFLVWEGLKEGYRRKRSFWVWPRYSLMTLPAYTPEPRARPTEEPGLS